MIIDDDLDMLFSRVGHGKPGLSEAELCAFDPLQEGCFNKDGEQPVSITDALLRLRKDLTGLLQDGERLSRFSVEYIHISKLIRNSVTVLGQGLMTLRKEGFDFSDYPLSIYELRCIASFHYRKTMNGMRVAFEANPTIYYRCMGEYLEWIKLLCRLEVSERRLAQPLPAPKQVTETEESSAEKVTVIKEEKPFPAEAPLPSVRALSPLSDSRRKKLLSAPQMPEEGIPEKEKVENEESLTLVAQKVPLSFDAFTLPKCETHLGMVTTACTARFRGNSHPPWEL